MFFCVEGQGDTWHDAISAAIGKSHQQKGTTVLTPEENPMGSASEAGSSAVRYVLAGAPDIALIVSPSAVMGLAPFTVLPSVTANRFISAVIAAGIAVPAGTEAYMEPWEGISPWPVFMSFGDDVFAEFYPCCG